MSTIEETNCSNIQYKGEISDVTPILKDYDVYALISNWEGLPIGIIEAMRAGLPILVSDVGGNSECVKDNGYLVKRQNIDDCKEKIKRLISLENDLKTLEQKSRKLYEEEFIINKFIMGTLKQYE